jgi:hypothetical protein
MKSINIILDEFEQRPQPESGIIRDGIIDYSRWQKAKKRILFIVKEGYTPDPEGKPDGLSTKGWDLCKDLRESPGFYGNTWREAAYWSHGIMHSKDGIFPQLSKLNTDEVLDTFRSTAVMNVKKTPGGKTSNWDELAEYVLKHRDLLKKQIDLIAPEVIICGGTWGLIKVMFPGYSEIYDQAATTSRRAL